LVSFIKAFFFCEDEVAKTKRKPTSEKKGKTFTNGAEIGLYHVKKGNEKNHRSANLTRENPR